MVLKFVCVYLLDTHCTKKVLLENKSGLKQLEMQSTMKLRHCLLQKSQIRLQNSPGLV